MPTTIKNGRRRVNGTSSVNGLVDQPSKSAIMSVRRLTSVDGFRTVPFCTCKGAPGHGAAVSVT